MSYSHLIEDYLDGNLGARDEEELFGALAADDDLRSELRCAVMLRLGVSADREAFVVPATAAAALLRQLGYHGQVDAPPTEARTLRDGHLARRIGSHAFVALLAGLAVALVMLHDAGQTSRPAGDRKASARRFDQGALQRSDQSPSDRLPSGSTDANFGPRLALNGGRRSVPESPAVARTPRPAENRKMAESAIPSPVVTVVDPRRVDPTSDRVLFHPSLNSSAARLKSPIIASIDGGADDESPQAKLVFSARVTAIPFGSERMKSASVMEPTESSALGVAVSLGNSRLGAVVEAGVDTYRQVFSSNRTAGATVVYDQRPVMLWGAAGVRFVPFDHRTIRPYLQCLAGGSEGGPVLRGMIGLDWNLSDRVRLTTGVEGSRLWYRFDGGTWSSERFGVVVGLAGTVMP